jgi:hypothetical protein
MHQGPRSGCLLPASPPKKKNPVPIADLLVPVPARDPEGAHFHPASDEVATATRSPFGSGVRE